MGEQVEQERPDATRRDAARRAVCLLSGGMDSAVAAAWAKDKGYTIRCLTVRYGQRHGREVEAARAVADGLGAEEHRVLEVPLDAFGGSSLMETRGADAATAGEASGKASEAGDATEPISEPEDRPLDEIGQPGDIPSTYVPARNTILIALAAAYAEASHAEAIIVGANALDYSGYPDCRPEYYQAMTEALRLGTKRGVEGDPIEILAPLIGMTKGEIVETGMELKAPLGATWSCYRGGDAPCGRCDACRLRAKGFEEAGVEDPALA